MLFCLWVWGPHETRDLAGRMGVSRPTVSGITDTLERRGLVERRGHADDLSRSHGRADGRGRAHVRRALPALQRRGINGLRGPRTPGSGRGAPRLLRTIVTTLTRGETRDGRRRDRGADRRTRIGGAVPRPGCKNDGREVWMDGEKTDRHRRPPASRWCSARPRRLVRLVPRTPRDVPLHRVADDRELVANVSLSLSTALARGSRSAAASACARMAEYHGGLMGRASIFLNAHVSPRLVAVARAGVTGGPSPR